MPCDLEKIVPFLDKLSKAYPNNAKIKKMEVKINNCNDDDMEDISKIYNILIQSQLGNRKRRKRSGKSRSSRKRKSRSKRSRKSLRGGSGHLPHYRFRGNPQERAERVAFLQNSHDARIEAQNQERFRQDTIVDATSNLGLLFAAFVIFWMLGGI